MVRSMSLMPMNGATIPPRPKRERLRFNSFEALLGDASETSRTRFYEDNFRRVFPQLG